MGVNGEYLKSQRINMGLTQHYIAWALEMSQSQISAIEKCQDNTSNTAKLYSRFLMYLFEDLSPREEFVSCLLGISKKNISSSYVDEELSVTVYSRDGLYYWTIKSEGFSSFEEAYTNACLRVLGKSEVTKKPLRAKDFFDIDVDVFGKPTIKY